MENGLFAEKMKSRTKKLAVDVIRLSKKLSTDYPGQVVSKQIIRSATSVAANYRAACRGRSTAEFAAKLGIVEEEADETCFWIEIMQEAGIAEEKDFGAILKEIREITAIVTASLKTTRSRYKR